MKVSDITAGTVGSNNWVYKNASPFGRKLNHTVKPANLYGASVTREDVYEGNYNQYLLDVLDTYFFRDLTTMDMRISYPRYDIKTYKMSGYTDVADGKHDVYIYVYDGVNVRRLTYGEVEIVGNPDKMLTKIWASWAGYGSLTNWDGGAVIKSGTDAISIDMSEDIPSGDESEFFNTIPVFDNQDNMGQYLQSEDPDPTHFGGYLSISDYVYKGEENPDTPESEGKNEDILGLGEDLGFSLVNGPMRGAVLDNDNLTALATKIGKGWFAGNISEAIIGIKIIRTPGVIVTEETTSIIPGTTLDPTAIVGRPITNQFQEFSFGTYKVSEKFNSFLDYTNTSVSLYLPYSGLHQLESKTIIGSEISLTCFIDYITGSLVWYVQVNRDGVRQVIYEFNGNCSMELVLSSIDYAQKITQALTGFAGITSGVAIGSVKDVLSGAGNLAKASSDSYVQVGNISSNFGWTGIQYPFLIFSRSKVKYPSNYNEMYGIPSFKKERLGNLKGYTQIGEIHLDGLTCLEEERQELETLLKNGVIL